MDDSEELEVLFLDIDGVLNSASSAVYYNRLWKNGNKVRKGYAKENFDLMAVSNLRNILETFPNLKIVVSSTWRLSGYEKVKEDLFFINPKRIIDITPATRRSHRGTEIGMWLKGKKVKRYVILDDDSDMGWRCIHLIQTRGVDGLTYSDMVRVIKRLKGRWEWGRLISDSIRWWIRSPLKRSCWRLNLWFTYSVKRRFSKSFFGRLLKGKSGTEKSSLKSG